MELFYLLRLRHIDCNSTVIHTKSMRNVVVKYDEHIEHIRSGDTNFPKI